MGHVVAINVEKEPKEYVERLGAKNFSDLVRNLLERELLGEKKIKFQEFTKLQKWFEESTEYQLICIEKKIYDFLDFTSAENKAKEKQEIEDILKAKV